MTNRLTSIYVMSVNIDDEDLIKERLNWMLDICWLPTAGSLSTTDGIVFAFRAKDDEEADRAATYLAVDRAFQLRTGLGVHRRDVA